MLQRSIRQVGNAECVRHPVGAVGARAHQVENSTEADVSVAEAEIDADGIKRSHPIAANGHIENIKDIMLYKTTGVNRVQSKISESCFCE